MTTKMWLVWRDNGGGPTIRHETKDSAEREAVRLARQFRGSRFYVLLAIGSVVVADEHWEWLPEYEPPPF